MALNYLMNFRFDEKYGLIWNAATADWGDVQFKDGWGVKLDENSYPAMSIYTNAMFLIAARDFALMCRDSATEEKWIRIHDQVARDVMSHLWDGKEGKFIPHLYARCSPFKGSFDENRIFYFGGTAVQLKRGC